MGAREELGSRGCAGTAGAEGARPGRARPAAIGPGGPGGGWRVRGGSSPGERAAGPQSPPRSEQRVPPSAEPAPAMREIVHIQAGQCGNQIGTKVGRALGFPAGGQAGRPRVSGLDPSVPALRCAPSVPLGPRSPTLPCAAPGKCSRSGAAEEGASQPGTPCPSPHPRSSWERPPAALARLEFGSRAPRALPRPASPGVSCGGGRPRLRVLTVCPPASPFPSFGK